MTDVISLAQRLHRKIKWQEVPEQMSWKDLTLLIGDAIRMLYVHTGRTLMFSEQKFNKDDHGEYIEYFEDEFLIDEIEWILLTAQIEFYRAVQASHDDDTSYTTDAMSVTHGDKPYEHIGQTIDRLEKDRNTVWYRMVRYNTLGVS